MNAAALREAATGRPHAPTAGLQAELAGQLVNEVEQRGAEEREASRVDLSRTEPYQAGPTGRRALPRADDC
jgi:hypothetical protein